MLGCFVVCMLVYFHHCFCCLTNFDFAVQGSGSSTNSSEIGNSLFDFDFVPMIWGIHENPVNFLFFFLSFPLFIYF
jgi:hypothetical protein